MLWHRSISALYQFSIERRYSEKTHQIPTPRSEALNAGTVRKLIKSQPQDFTQKLK